MFEEFLSVYSSFIVFSIITAFKQTQTVITNFSKLYQLTFAQCVRLFVYIFKARRNLILTDRPIPQHLTTHYFEIHFGGLPTPPMYVDACGAPVGKNASHDTFMVGLWVGGTSEHDSRNRNLPADAPGCLWYVQN